MLRQYALHSLDPHLAEFFTFVKTHDLRFEVHLARTRVLIPTNTAIHTEFLLRFPRVEDLGLWRE